jgi:hypothetical protein
MSKGIRRYGPGKFNTILDSYIYAMIGEGMGAESCGDVSEVGFAAELIELGDADALKEVERIAKEEGDELTQEEKDMILESAGAIMVENEQGFVSVDYYDTEKEMKKDWAEIEEDASSDEDDEDEDEEEESEENAETEEAE